MMRPSSLPTGLRPTADGATTGATLVQRRPTTRTESLGKKSMMASCDYVTTVDPDPRGAADGMALGALSVD